MEASRTDRYIVAAPVSVMFAGESPATPLTAPIVLKNEPSSGDKMAENGAWLSNVNVEPRTL